MQTLFPLKLNAEHTRARIRGKSSSLLIFGIYYIYLFIGKLFCLLVDVALVEIRGQRHESHFGQAEVGEFDVTEGGDEKIVRFQITMDDPEAVKVLHGQHSLLEVKP